MTLQNHFIRGYKTGQVIKKISNLDVPNQKRMGEKLKNITRKYLFQDYAEKSYSAFELGGLIGLLPLSKAQDKKTLKTVEIILQEH